MRRNTWLMDAGNGVMKGTWMACDLFRETFVTQSQASEMESYRMRPETWQIGQPCPAKRGATVVDKRPVLA